MPDSTPAALHTGATPLLQTVGMTKRYGTFLANDAIDHRYLAAADPRAARRERRRQIDAGQDHLRPDPAERRRNALAGREDRCSSGPSEARARGIGMVFQHFSLFDNLTVAENVALGLDGDGILRGHVGAAGGSLARLRPAARSQARGLAAVGRRAPAHRDRARADAESETPDPRRADRGADAAGGRPALHRARAAQGRGPRDPLHQPQARRGEAALRHRDHPARRQEGRDLQSAARRPRPRSRA